MASHRDILAFVGLLIVGCHASGGASSNGSEQQGPVSDAPPISSDDRESPAGTRYPIYVEELALAPFGELDFLECWMPKVVAGAKGLPPDSSVKPVPLCEVWWLQGSWVKYSNPWIAKVQVINGPNVTEGKKLDVWNQRIGRLFVQWRYFDVKVVEVWFGKPSRSDYQLWDLGGYCPGDYPYCPDGDLVFDPNKCLRIEGMYRFDSGSCEYRDPNTGQLLVYISGLDWPSGLESGAEFILFGGDFSGDLEPFGWATVANAGGDLTVSTVTGSERLLYRIDDNLCDVAFLYNEDFPGSRGLHGSYYVGPRWIPQWMLAQRILERMVTPYLRDHPEDRPFVESALSGPLLQEYLSPTPLPPEFQSDAN